MNKTILSQIIKRVQQKLPREQLAAFSVFVEQFYNDEVWSDFAERSAEDLLGSVLAHWQLLYQRQSKQSKLKVYNPTLDKDGWECAHTIVLLAHEDMPFLVDSLQVALNRLGCPIHHLVHLGGIKIERDQKGFVTKVVAIQSFDDKAFVEAPIYIEIEKQFSAKELSRIATELEAVLEDVGDAVRDWPLMQQKVLAACDELEETREKTSVAKKNIKLWQESEQFLRWLTEDHFVFLGYRSYKMANDCGDDALEFVSGSSLGFLRNKDVKKICRYFKDLPDEAVAALKADEPLLLVKTNTLSTVHKPVYTDSIIIKRYDEKGKFIGIHRFIGLYARTLYYSSISFIPYLRYKAALILQRFGMPQDGYSSKTLQHIIETFPRDDFIQASIDELYTIITGIFQLHERRLVKLFVRQDVYGHYVSCLVYLPRDNFNTDLRLRIQDILMRTFAGTGVDFNVWFPESILARIHFVIRLDAAKPIHYDFNALEQEIIAVSTSWYDGLRNELAKIYDRKNAEILAQKYYKVFSAGFCETFLPSFAAEDIQKIESLFAEDAVNNLALHFYHLPTAASDIIQLKLFCVNKTLVLSDTLPILENLGFHVLGEQSHHIHLHNDKHVYISDFNMTAQQDNVVAMQDVSAACVEAFSAIWHGKAENDGFNRLVVFAGLGWREISVLRSYAKYLWQIRFPYAQQSMENTLARYPQIARLLVEYFQTRFVPGNIKNREESLAKLRKTLNAKLVEVTSLDDENIITNFMMLIDATVRTNYYQNKDYISFKFLSAQVSNLPLPHPLFEIFVYAPYFEGVHLRMAKVARGGLRWSDRREDFRTEVLGLVKAQQVKNVVIVPYGAKGGFVLKRTISDKDQLKQEGVYCYKKFISALLDITDNIVDGKIVPPSQVVRYDEDDPYLVVAADKGTASFSDTANKISQEYNFWLRDAFASGGSAGYDHKKIGITAKGAWESVIHHFYELGINVAKDDFTVVGIGDMSGDVFGNGMILSEHIKLLGAFNHQHIFLDPNPNAAKSFRERQRLFNSPQLTWDDYDKKLLSKGGGVYARSAKTIPLSSEVKALLGINKDTAAPNEVIKAMLKLPVDLLWNGGIGTYVKATTESHDAVGDRNNDALRVNANELRCKVISEGGNLGMTQLGRVEYCLAGGICNTDFIDNSGGVDCSDHEVNIKILLNAMVDSKKLSLQARNILLAKMTDDVSNLVLQNNYRQTRAIGVFTSASVNSLPNLMRFIDTCEAAGKLNRELEFLPNNKALQERREKQQGLTRPEIAVLLAYSKLILKGQILSEPLLDDAYFAKYVAKEFPQQLTQKFELQLAKHRLRREIISTHLSNDFVTDLGISFFSELQESGHVTLEEALRAYVIAKEILQSEQVYAEINKLDFIVTAQVQADLVKTYREFLRSAVKWFLRYLRSAGKKQSITQSIAIFQQSMQKLDKQLLDLLTDDVKQDLVMQQKELVQKKVPTDLAKQFTKFSLAKSMLDTIAIALLSKMPLNKAWQIRCGIV